MTDELPENVKHWTAKRRQALVLRLCNVLAASSAAGAFASLIVLLCSLDPA